MDKILDVMEDVKRIMDSLMEINKEKGQEKSPYITLIKNLMR